VLAADMTGDIGGGEMDGVVAEFHGTSIGWMFVMELQTCLYFGVFLSLLR
jgi:hypothetical protein